MQKPGRAPLKNKSFEALTNGTPLRNDNDKDKEKKTGETRKRPNSEIKTGDRPKGSGRVYSKENKATKSTIGTIGGNKSFRYKSGNKIYTYEPGVQNNNPKTGIRL